MHCRIPIPILATLAALALACSPKVVAGDAAAGADAGDVGLVDSVGDVAGDAADVEETGDAGTDAITDAIDLDEIGDAITDAIDAGPEVDAADGDDTPDAIKDALPAVETADVPLPSDCTGDALLPPPDATVLTDVGPLVPNKVVTGCGKGKPEPVAQGSECCDCPPPYSCYCNGECAWLRTPDMKIPNQGGEGVWTGKWVVTVANVDLGYMENNGQWVFKNFVQRWNPASNDGFLASSLPGMDTGVTNLRLFVVGGKVIVGTEAWGSPLNASGVGPDRPAYWYEPETDKYEAIAMPKCSGLVATATHLACCDGGFGGDKGAVHLYDVAAKSWSKVMAPAGLLPVGASICWASGEGLIADAGNLYFIAPVSIFGTEVWPDGSMASDGGHVIRYDIPGGSWKDLGSVPTELLKNQEFIVPIIGNILFGVNAAGLKLGLFDLATGKTKVVKANSELFFPGVVLPLDCGLLISTANYIGPPGPRGQSEKSNVPALIRPDLSIQLFPSWGFPSDDRGMTTTLKSEKEILVLGGYNGGYEHKDGYRYPLSQVCKGAEP